MSGSESGAANEATVTASIAEGLEPASETVKKRMPWWGRILVGLGVTAAILVITGLLLYNFGGMSGSEFDPEIREQYQRLVESGQVAPVERRFVIGIPGCTCHSEDPYLTEQHRNRRMRECGGCHARVGP